MLISMQAIVNRAMKFLQKKAKNVNCKSECCVFRPTNACIHMVENDRKHINFNLSWLGNTVINNNFSPLNDNISAQLRTHGHDNCRPFL